MTSIEIPFLFLFEGLVLLPELVNIRPLRGEGLAGLRKDSADLPAHQYIALLETDCTRGVG